MFLIHLFFILRKKWSNFIARPRTVRFMDGKVMLKDFPVDIANELEAYVAKFKRAESLVALKASKNPELALNKPYADKAIGLCEKSPGQFKVVVIGFSCEANDSRIEQVIDAGDFKQHAASVFQQEIFKRGII